MHMQTRPENRGELGWRGALARSARRKAAWEGREPSVSAWGLVVGHRAGTCADRGASPALYWREAKCDERERDSRVAQGHRADVKAAQPLGSDVRTARSGKAPRP